MNTDIELINWVESGHYRISILKRLSNQPKNPSELAEICNINRASVSRILKDLKKKNLVDSTKESAKNKLYFITSEGKRLLDILSEMRTGGEAA